MTAFNEPLEIEDIKISDPGPHDVVVQVTASGVCHSDVSLWNGSVPQPPPIVLGHEGTGVIESVGSDVTRVKPGDRVVAAFVPACGECFYCRQGQPYLCDTWTTEIFTPRFFRNDGTPMTAMCGLGTFSDVMTVSESAVIPITTDLPPEQVALIGCGVTTGAFAALNTAQVKPGATVAVIGCGGVGQAVIQGAKIAGASEIYAVDPVELKRKTAEQFGATHGIDPTAENPIAKVQGLTEGRGADYAFEVIGLPETIIQAFEMTRPGGTCVVVGMPRMDAEVTFPAFNLMMQEKRVLGCKFGSAQIRRDFPRLIKLAETGRFDLDGMVSRRISIDEVNDAFRAMLAGEVIRSVIVAR
jgi:S-(hydroxymethyl)glutathione dehydrogenase/alcohol dehydrogenase